MFGFGKNIFIGLDIGTSAIKMVEISIEDDRPVLSNYAWAPFSSDKEIESNRSDFLDNSISENIKRIAQKGGFSGKKISVAIPSFGGFVALIDLPEVSQGDMEQAVRYEAQKYIPTSLEDVSFNWNVVGHIKGEQGDNLMQVLLAAAPKEVVSRYEKIISDSGFKLVGLEIESFSLVTSLVGSDPGEFIIVDIGSRVCNIILVEKGVVKINRNLDAGGKEMTKAISKSMGIDEKRAEEIKISGKDFFKSESYINFPIFDLITEEIKRLMNIYEKKEGGKRIDAVIVSGGAASLYGINEYFSRKIGVSVIKGKPFARVSYNTKLENWMEKEGTRFSVCAGLAIREAESYLVKKRRNK